MFLCAGNHDLHRYQEMPAIKTEIEKIKTIKDLDDFASKNPRQFKESLTNFINYNEFVENFYSKYPPKKKNSMKFIVCIQFINVFLMARRLV